MILKPTVLILGAGASKPYGYPLGSELRDILCGVSGDMAALVVKAGHELEAIKHFAAEFGNSNLASIDVFLERRPRLAPLGRAMIAAALLHRDSYNLKGDWYAYLWQQLSHDAPDIESFKKNALKVITFNYDTSFERFMINSLRASYDVTLDQAQKTISDVLPVIHVHGYIPYKLAGQVVTPNQVTPEFVQESSDRIITLHQGEDKSPEFTTAREWLASSQRIMILGFSYQSENVRRLRTHDWLTNGKVVRGTTFGLIGQEAARVTRMFQSGGAALSFEDRDCLEMVRHNVTMFD